MTAEAAERGGADFLLALNAGRFRVMGTASVAAMMPLANSNAFTDAFARREILDRVSIPVFFGACVFDPDLEIERLVGGLVEAGYDGVANFPTSIHYDGRLRRALDEAGLGYAREAELLAAAGRAGLATFGYAKTRSEIDRLLGAGTDIVCLNFGWNAGGVKGILQDISLTEAANRARRVFQDIRLSRPETLCVVEGGPIVKPDDMFRVCRDARADGYVGGSTLDRMPLELSVMQITSAFKSVAILKEASVVRDRQVTQAARLAGIVGSSEATQALLERLVRLSRTSLPLLVSGEAGTGKVALARATHALGRRKGPILQASAEQSEDLSVFLFGAPTERRRSVAKGALETPFATVIVESAESIPDDLAAAILGWIEAEDFERGARPQPGRARLVLLRRTEPGGGHPAPLSPDERWHRFLPGHVFIAPLRERPEDIPPLVRAIIETLAASRRGRRIEVTADGYRALFAHDWPGNLRELRSLVEEAALAAEGGEVGSALVQTLLRVDRPGDLPPPPPSEKGWILDGLRRNRFRRQETAAFLGISRKTLYNRMKHHGLLD